MHTLCLPFVLILLQLSVIAGTDIAMPAIATAATTATATAIVVHAATQITFTAASLVSKSLHRLLRLQ
jgi:hypothetical protein